MILIAQEEPDRARLASHAQSFAEQLPNLVGSETLKQKSITYSTRMRIRFGDAALKPIPPKVQERTIHSDLGFALRGKEEPVWYELRKVIDVDGRRVATPKKARERLAFGLQSDNERERLRLMEEFSRYGLEALATDYSLSLLLFRFGEIDKLRFELESTEYLGATPVLVYSFSRPDNEVGITIFDRKNATRQPLLGRIWVQRADMLPLRLRLDSRLEQDKTVIVDSGVIEYVQSRFGAVLPSSVIHTRMVNGTLVNETHYSYQDFQKFGADAELKFTP